MAPRETLGRVRLEIDDDSLRRQIHEFVTAPAADPPAVGTMPAAVTITDLRPGAAGSLSGRVSSIGQPDPTATAPVVCVIGARGGSGATTVAVALAREAARDRPVVLVDADTYGAGIDLPLGVEGTEGVRWPELAEVRDRIPKAALTGRLPSVEGIDIIACRGGSTSGMSAAWVPVMASLRAAYTGVIADLPRYRLPATPMPPGSRAVIVTTLDLAGVTAGRRLADSGAVGRDPVIALRPVGAPLSLRSASRTLDGLTMVEFPTSRAVTGAADFGDLAAAVARGSVRRAAQRVLGAVT